MGSQLALKGRIASTGSLEKIFNAQEMIASSHIAKARDVALNAKPYADAIFDAVQAVVAHTRITHPIVKKEEDNPKVAVLALTADRGMAGAYTSSIIRETEELLTRLDDAQSDHAQTHERHGGQRHDAHPAGQILVQPAEAQVQHGHHRAGGVADRRRDGQLDIAQADIAERHRHDVQQRHGQVRPDDVPRHAHAADEDLIRRVQAHDDADGDDHF